MTDIFLDFELLTMTKIPKCHLDGENLADIGSAGPKCPPKKNIRKIAKSLIFRISLILLYDVSFCKRYISSLKCVHEPKLDQMLQLGEF